MINAVEFEGELVESEALRYTPAGLPLLRFKLAHRSKQIEAGVERDIECEIGVLATQTEARMMASVALGSTIKVSGFLDRKGKSNRQAVLHARTVELIAANRK